MERKMAQHIERKIMENHQCQDTFELCVLDRPAPQVDLSTLQAAVECLRANLDTILEARVTKSKALSAEPAEDTIFVTLFSTIAVQPPLPRENAKRRTCQNEDEARAQKRERR